MEFMVTPEFLERYERLGDSTASCVDGAIRRVVSDPGNPWARQSRVVGEHGWSWLVVMRCGQEDLALHWQQATPDDPVVFLLLLTH